MILLLFPALLEALVTFRRGPWKIDRYVDVLHGEVFFHDEDLGAFLLVVAMLMMRMAKGQRGRGKVRKQTAKSRCTHGWSFFERK